MHFVLQLQLLELLKEKKKINKKRKREGGNEMENVSRLLSGPDNGSGFMQQYWFALGKQVRRK